MDNRFQFRAWLKQEKKIVFPRAVYANGGDWVDVWGADGLSYPVFGDTFTLMQSTGIKAGSKLIYEGDIAITRNSKIGVVKYENAMFMIEWLHGDLYKCPLGEVEIESVLGNVYENSELLEAD